jgi:hypothetical protein
VDPFAIASGRGIVVEPKDCEGGVSGMLLRHGENYGIVYSRSIKNEGFQRFSVAHELGHYFLPDHPMQIFRDSPIHRSSAGYNVVSSVEREADDFAAGLLMPSRLIKREIVGKKDGLAGIEAIQVKCRTSLVASAIRYIDVTSAPAAVVVSKNDHIEFCFCSDELLEFKGLVLPRAKSAVPSRTLTEQFNREDKRRESGRDKTDVPMGDWFGAHPSVEMVEEVVGLGRYERVLTVLTATESADEDDDPDDSDEWEPPTFRR